MPLIQLGVSEGDKVRFEYRDATPENVELLLTLLDNGRLAAVAKPIGTQETYNIVANTAERSREANGPELPVYQASKIDDPITENHIPGVPAGDPYRWITNIEPVGEVPSVHTKRD